MTFAEHPSGRMHFKKNGDSRLKYGLCIEQRLYIYFQSSNIFYNLCLSLRESAMWRS